MTLAQRRWINFEIAVLILRILTPVVTELAKEERPKHHRKAKKK